ncbi:MAG: IucA/IucC family protein [Paenibacillus sp.]|jgi:siderophore synthetase component|nr:IucA/IucC family protein [Paenibacillus sp.]
MKEARTDVSNPVLNKDGELNERAGLRAIQKTDGTKDASSLQRAEEDILADLVNALLAEGLLDTQERGRILTAAELEIRTPVLRSFLPKMPLYAAAAESPVDSAHREPSIAPVSYFHWLIDRVTGHCIVFPVRPAVIQAYRYVKGHGVYEVKADQLDVSPVSLGPMELLQRVTDELYNRDRQKHSDHGEDGVSRLVALLGLSLDQTEWSLKYDSPEHRSGESSSLSAAGTGPEVWNLIKLERQASFRDRPFHPVAKAKGGWKQADYDAYSAEAGQPIVLEWVAVKRSRLVSGSGSGSSCSGGVKLNGSLSVSENDNDAGKVGCIPSIEPADLLLSPGDRRLVEDAMARCGLTPDAYMALPVHPWQKAAVLPQMLGKELKAGIWMPLETRAGIYLATSSSRSLAPLDGGPKHVKLPLGIVSLGAVRYLPAVHMMNSERGQRLLEQARERDTVLRERLSLCDERSWWAYVPDDGDLFADPPRHLSAMVRLYPADITGGNRDRLVPMSALAVQGQHGGEPVFSVWMRERGMRQSLESAAILFGEICFEFFQISLRLFRLGVLPEIHGQNAVLILKDGYISGLLLRDHDSVRLHLPWLKEHGLDDPCYKMKPGYPNSLYNETPEKLLFYLQTLGIQVNLYSILEAVACRYHAEEKRLWSILRESLHRAIETAGLSAAVKGMIESSLFDKPVWPWKNILKPLLEQKGSVSGSMPSGAGETVNPFR